MPLRAIKNKPFGELSLRRVYLLLLRRFGPQGWWPVSVDGTSPAVYSQRFTAGRLAAGQALEMSLGALLTQNTAWTNASRSIEALRGAGALSVDALARLSLSRLRRLIHSSGYFRQKADRVKVFIRHLQNRGGLSVLSRQETASARAELLSLRGIGPETADSILLYAGHHPVFVVDAYSIRIFQRLGFGAARDYPSLQKMIHSRLAAEVPLYREFHALLVTLAKDHCRVKPVCGGCPLETACQLAQSTKGGAGPCMS